MGRLQTIAPNAVAVIEGNYATLFSYDTEIIKVCLSTCTIEKVTKYWDYSASTARHINAFGAQFHIDDLTSYKPKSSRKERFKQLGLI